MLSLVLNAVPSPAIDCSCGYGRDHGDKDAKEELNHQTLMSNQVAKQFLSLQVHCLIDEEKKEDIQYQPSIVKIGLLFMEMM